MRRCLWDSAACVWRCFKAPAAWWASIPKAKLAAMVACGAVAGSQPWVDAPAVYAAPEPDVVFRPSPGEFTERVRALVPGAPVDVPEPGSWLLFATGLVAIWRIRKWT